MTNSRNLKLHNCTIIYYAIEAKITVLFVIRNENKLQSLIFVKKNKKVIFQVNFKYILFNKKLYYCANKI